MIEHLYIHIGMSKTATTSLEEYLHINSEALKKHSFIYPESGRCMANPYAGKIAHHKLASSLREEPHENVNHHTNLKFEEYVSSIVAESDGYNNVVISSDLLCHPSVNFNELKLLKKYFREISIVMYLRRADDLANTCYNFFSYVVHKKDLQKGDPIYIMDAYKTIFSYAEVFGEEHIIVRPFEREQLKNHSIFSDFLNVLNIEETNEFQSLSARPNETEKNLFVVEFYWYIRKYFPEYLKELITPCREYRVHNVTLESESTWLQSHYSPQERIDFISEHAPFYEMIEKRFLNNKKLFIEPTPSLSEKWHPTPDIPIEVIIQMFGILHLQNVKEKNKLTSKLGTQQIQINEQKKVIDGLILRVQQLEDTLQ
ncbi:hypothetical protein [Paraglaciecola sp. 2405UD69-4]|uniref:hypothetical protein n=1 Tax=Paraglaciecola sp. 2405UD69-4 TaxID=3391836 RepID=UPI0039C93F04